MNHRDKLRIEERRRDSLRSETHGSSNQHANPKNVMDSYAQSQQVIKSLSAKPLVPETDATKTPEISKPFRIPRKQNEPDGKVGRQDPSNSYPRITPPEKKFIDEPPPFDSGGLSRRRKAIRKKEMKAEASNARQRPKEKRFANQKPCKLLIFDRSQTDLKIGENNVAALIEGLTKLLKETILSPVKKYPTFLGHYYDKGQFVIICANFASREFIRREVERMPPPWPGAQLNCADEAYEECFVSLVIPESISHVSEFIHLCKKGNTKLCTEKWRLISVEGRTIHDSGNTFVLGMDLVSYELIQTEGSVRCGDEDVKLELIPRKRGRINVEKLKK